MQADNRNAGDNNERQPAPASEDCPRCGETIRCDSYGQCRCTGHRWLFEQGEPPTGTVWCQEFIPPSLAMIQAFEDYVSSAWLSEWERHGSYRG